MIIMHMMQLHNITIILYNCGTILSYCSVITYAYCLRLLDNITTNRYFSIIDQTILQNTGDAIMAAIYNRRSFLQSAGGALSASLLTGCATEKEPLPEKKPNFVFILVDDLGWMDLGCYGSSLYDTPNVDRLASQGMRFTDAYAACPVCSPTRASIMTGKYPARVGITDWIPGYVTFRKDEKFKLDTPEDRHELPFEEVTIAEVLKDSGYATLFAGKWHLGKEPYLPDRQGFVENIGGNATGQPKGGYFSPYDNPQLTDGPEGEYLTDRLGDESLKFIESNTENPFLLYLSFYTVHTPIQSKDDYRKDYEEKIAALPEPYGPRFIPEGEVSKVRQFQDDPGYAGMIRSMDENVGRVLDKINELNLDDTTIVIFMSDNGGLSTVPWEGPTSNVPLRAGKGWLYEGGIRTPMIVKWPGVVKPGSISDTPVTSTDFYPTMLEMAGLGLRPEQHADGVSMTPLLKGTGTLDRDAIFWHFPHYHGSGSKPGGAVRSGDYKLIEFFENNRIELYNLKDDISERSNLADTLPDKKNELYSLLINWREETGAKMPTLSKE